MIRYFTIYLIVYLGIGASYGLRWHPSGLVNNTETVISLQSTILGPSIDIYRDLQINILKDVKNYRHTINIYCFIGGFNKTDVISYSFCKDSLCLRTLKDGQIYETKFYGMNIKMNSRVSGQKGFKLELKFLSDGSDVSGSYSCRAFDTAQHLEIVSNYVQIRDVNYWMTHLVLNSHHSEIKLGTVINRSNLPITFKCDSQSLVFKEQKPGWINEEIPFPVEWSVCPVRKDFRNSPEYARMTFSKCKMYTTDKWKFQEDSIRPRKLNEMKSWNYLINTRGELKIFDVNFDSIDKDISYAFMCYVRRNNRAEPISTHFMEKSDDYIVRGITFDGSVSSDNQQLMMISERTQHQTLFSRKVHQAGHNPDVQTIPIYAEYLAPPRASITWFYNGNRIESRMDRIIDNYKVTFPLDITSDMAGNYSIVIVDQHKPITTSIIVKVLEFPTLLNPDCLPLIRHIWERKNLQLRCAYKNNVKVFRVLINNYEITRNVSMTELTKKFPYLGNITFKIQETRDEMKNQISINYNIFNLQGIRGPMRSEDHSVTFRVENELGSNVRSTSIYVIPIVDTTIEEYPKWKDCPIQCQLQCRIKREPYKNKELLIKLYWTVNKYRLNPISNSTMGLLSYFSINSLTNELTVNYSSLSQYAVANPTETLIHIICHIDLISTESNQYFFKSIDDKYLNHKLEIRVNLQKSNVASISLMVTAIGILLVVIITVVIIFQRKDRGETYQISKLEKICGIDQEKELKNEIFQPYEYQDLEIDLVSTHSAFTTGSSQFDELEDNCSDLVCPRIIYKPKSRQNLSEMFDD